MDAIKTEFLEQMLKTGRAYPHEIRSIADELIQRRDGNDPTKASHDDYTDYFVVKVPRIAARVAPRVDLVLATDSLGRGEHAVLERNRGVYVIARLV